ncbi:hypothetical protein BDN71DRAFT_1511646 [Pleurotus eryngii]|uniref:Uncharacterized protein n=1 Tax=Pleurotus eryngii TaxID=5323 RepID=A0A9P6DBS9_PLEER|nr:hypothetical protein BDN71DRAFT_1511646 [Pleurotus eryngii]
MCAVFRTVSAVEPGNNALGMGVSDGFETSVQKEYGPIVLDNLAAGGCAAWKCLGTVAKSRSASWDASRRGILWAS